METIRDFLITLKSNLQKKLVYLKNYLQSHKAVTLFLAALLGLFLFFSLFSLLHRPSVQRQRATKVSVHTKQITASPMYKTVSLFGQTAAIARIEIVNKYPGTILRVDKNLGDTVEPGDILLQQDLKDVELQVARAQADYKSHDASTERYDARYNSDYQKAKSEYDLKKLNFERYTQLFQKGAISKLSLDQAELAMVNAQANLKYLTDQKSINGRPAYVAERAEQAELSHNSMLLLQNQQEDMTIRAPRKGIISYRNAEAGSYVAANTHLFTLVDNSSFYIDCLVSEYDAALLKAGETVSANLEALGKKYPGTLTFVSPDKNKDTKNYLVRITLDSTDSAIKSGMFAKSELKFLQKDKALCINRSAIFEKNGKTYAFIIDNDHKVQRKAVQLGIRNEEETEITEGLKEGDRVIIDNITRLREGTEVEDLGTKVGEK